MANIAWAVAYDDVAKVNAGVYKFDGSTWSYIDNVTAGIGGYVHVSMWGISATDIWFATSRQDFTRFHHYLNGAWTTQDVAVRIQRMWGNAANDIWGVGWTLITGANSLIEWWHYDGTSWTQFQVDATPALYQYHIFGKNASTIWSMKETAGGDLTSRTRYNDGSNTWTDDNSAILSDAGQTWFGVYGLYHPGGTDLFYMLTRTNAKLLALYTRDGIANGTWTLLKQIATAKAQSSGNLLYNNCVFKLGDKIWAIHPNSGGGNAECWYSSDGGANFADVTPAGPTRLCAIHGNSDGSVWMGGDDATALKRYVFKWNNGTSTWDSTDLSGLAGTGTIIMDIWVAEPTNDNPQIQTNIPTIGSDFTINNYIISPYQNTSTSGSFQCRTTHVPYFLNSPTISLRSRKIPYSSSIGR